MDTIKSVMDPKAFHILSYGSFLGVTLFQSFVGGVIAYKVLPRPQFATLQQATFPVFFSIQTILPAIMAVTYPGNNIASAGSSHLTGDSGLAGVLAEGNRWTVLAPLATILVTSLANLVVLGPATTKAMKERHHQETRDGKKSYDAGPQSQEMQRLNTLFATLHSVSTVFNLTGLGAAVYYAYVLAKRI